MKQSIFLVEPFQAPNSFKLTKDLAKFPFENESKRVNVQKQLHNLAEISIGASQFSGLFIFGLDKEQCRFTFSWFSFPTFAASLRLVILIATLAYHQAYKGIIDNLIDSKALLDSVLGASEGILISTVLVSDVLGMFLMWKGRKGLELFINQFNETLVLFADEVKNRNWMTGWFHEVSKKARWLVTSISITSYILTLVSIHWSLFNILLFILGKDEATFFDWTYPIFGFFWFYILVRRLHFPTFLMTMIDKLQFGFRTVKDLVREFTGDEVGKSTLFADIRVSNAFERLDSDKKEVSRDDVDTTVTDYIREVKLNEVVEKYRSMESLLGEFNELFSSHLIIGIGSILIIMLMALFHFFVEVNEGMSVVSVIFAAESVLHIWVLHSLGSSATDMANEAEECITLLRDVPIGNVNPVLKQKIMLHFQQALAVPLVISPGNFFSLNRQMITSVAGTLTTYLIVLIQFQSTEKNPVSESPGLQNLTSLKDTLTL